MTDPTPARCQQAKVNGTGCGAYPLAGSPFCFFHDPAKGAERTAARQAGGRKHRAAVLPPETPDRPLTTVADVVTLLAETINQVRRGALDPKVANTMCYLAALLLKALEQGDVERQVAEWGQQPVRVELGWKWPDDEPRPSLSNVPRTRGRSP